MVSSIRNCCLPIPLHNVLFFNNKFSFPFNGLFPAIIGKYKKYAL